MELGVIGAAVALVGAGVLWFARSRRRRSGKDSHAEAG